MVEPTPTPGTLELAKKVSLPSLPTRDELANCEPMLSAPVPALMELIGLSSNQGVTRVGTRDRGVKGRHQ